VAYHCNYDSLLRNIVDRTELRLVNMLLLNRILLIQYDIQFHAKRLLPNWEVCMKVCLLAGVYFILYPLQEMFQCSFLISIFSFGN
jgi:hypothetical protein